MVWQKSNFSNPSRNRYHQIFEYMFIFSKGTPAIFNPIKDKRNSYAGKGTLGKNTFRQEDGSYGVRKRNVIADYGMRLNVWRMNTTGQENPCKAIEHPATFPEKLAYDHIRSWSNPESFVLDPFMGSGTTGVACRNLNRNFIGVELDGQYFEIARKRINQSPS